MSVDEVLAKLTTSEKAALLSGGGRWINSGVERLGLGPIKMVDGPVGARGDSRVTVPAVVIPAPVALGATWDIDLVQRVGVLLGRETLRRKAQMLLAPTLNLQRTPIGGRNFEFFSEDPELVSQIAVAYIAGVQSQGVAATAKHFVGNDTEDDRHGVDCRIDESTLREVYLRPFEAAVAEADVMAVMAAYNGLNGAHCTENEWLLRDVLRDEWGFAGIVVSDWHAVRSTQQAVAAGTTIEMPGPAIHYGETLVAAVESGLVAESLVDGLVREVLTVCGRIDWPERGDETEESIDDPIDRALCREAATAGTVLLANNGVLPISDRELGSIVIVGPLGDRAQIQGGGSAKMVPLPTITLRRAIEERLAEGVDVGFTAGVDMDKRAPVILKGLVRANGEPGMDLALFDGRDATGDPVVNQSRHSSEISWQAGVPIELDPDGWSVRVTGRYTASIGGVHRFSMLTTGAASLYQDDAELIGPLNEADQRGDAYYSLAGPEVYGEQYLNRGQTVDLRIEYSTEFSPYPAVRVGCRQPQTADPIGEAVELARSGDVAVVAVGTTDEWETEGNDRDSLGLPAGQDELVSAVAKVNPRTIVVVNVGAPIAMPWLDEVAAVLLPWFGGIEAGPALVDVLFGDTDPGGRLPVTFPLSLSDHPAADHYPGVDQVMVYGEGQLVGHRGYRAAGTDVLFPFGHGLSYASFDFGDLVVEPEADTGDLVARVSVTNTSERTGSTVVQLYAHRVNQSAPVLAGFSKVHLGPLATTVAEVHIHARTLTEWRLDRWYMASGAITFSCGVSSREMFASTAFKVL